MILAICANSEEPVPAEELELPDCVVNVTGDSFINFTKGKNKSEGFLVYFGAPWCKHCKIFKPVFYDLAKKAEAAQIPIWPTFIQYEVENLDEVGKLFRVTAYPSLYYIKDDKVWKFEGRRVEEEIINWIQRISFGEEEETERPYPDHIFSFGEELEESWAKLKRYVRHRFYINPVATILFGLAIFLVCGLVIFSVFLMCTQPYVSPENEDSSKEIEGQKDEKVKNE